MARPAVLTRADAEAAFLAAWPEYRSTAAIDALRAREYARLDQQNHVYLDYTAGGLYAECQLREHVAMLASAIYGNPHSASPASLAMTERVNRARASILAYFDADPAEYEAIFTCNASAGLKIVGESYPFGPGSVYALLFDNHNSVNGIREFARARGAEVRYVPIRKPELRIDEERLDAALDDVGAGAPRLFAYPAQSNYSGVQHSLDWIARAQDRGWDVILDAAAFVPTNRLDLSRVHPDFVPISFYKMFGYPTGVGALIARKQALRKLRRPWFGGGTVTVASVQGERFYLAEGAAAFEDGTLDYLMLPAVEIGLKHLSDVGVDTVHARVTCLTGWLLEQLASLRHANGEAAVRLYGPADTRARGGTIAMNFYRPDGQCVDHREIRARANQEMISLRTGFFCNPGESEVALGFSRDELLTCFDESDPSNLHVSVDDFRSCFDGRCSGAVRVSVGLASNFADVWRFAEFARRQVETG
jgi:selenocysteine lyase/cysteine desulfurase